MISTNTQIVVCNFQIILIETFTRKNIYEIHRKNIYECNFVRFNPSKWFKNYTFKEYLWNNFITVSKFTMYVKLNDRGIIVSLYLKLNLRLVF